MSLGQLSSNIVHHVFSTVNGAFAWPPSSKVAGTAFFTAAQVLAFYLFATVDNFSFPVTTSYLSLRARVQVENPDIQLLEQIFFNALIKPTLQFGYQLFRSVKDLVFNDFDQESTERIDELLSFDLGQITGAGFVEGPRHGAALQWLCPDGLFWRWEAKGKRLFFDIKINNRPGNHLRVIFREGPDERFDN
ncbi:hypothetical protein NEUTE1DRAFT_99007 [Neurospora tetrasperma FGSC 2508]|uniref:Uncharacterized protein n=1 Tax=Neurospora tetrasperma (strain FGSC 2508 / ATCC MYA-4615 / P0657) TaxID=510951 RepID=F8MHJ5_NEUT8|nr:uncharacterized protein NEUTE1DRAFT_99007 [Neurospora tetrasperma FGSC 2508]EGO58807.1 hypothetical protein NEUTE1DRAFT_99007 [Neurospora tetrasperma FGSC 2508]EGZ72907.1 hypothetical protein NEUTE2DRAFT_59851 [Neurospora tetrasperma FGSC 2509]